MGSENGTRYLGLLVDWGGVLTTSLFDSFGAFCEAERLDPKTVATAFRKDPAARELLIGLETGALDEDEFEPQLAALLGVAPASLIDRLFAGAGPEEAMVQAVLAARLNGIRTGLISNSWGTRRYDRELLARMFDGIVISGEEGMRKPAPAMYSLGAERIGVAPDRCVYVDDLAFNLEPANELGMTTVHHVTAEQTVTALEDLLGVPLR
jgi:epoxide hydrolase-like predicted phosphatase